MIKIKFSHTYFKMPVRFEKSALIQVINIDAKEISDSLYDYDTTYATGFNEVAKYPLPAGRLILLMLKSKAGLLWTTIRRWTPEKEQYYRRLVGQVVECEVTEDSEQKRF